MTRAGGGHVKISPSRYLGYSILMWFASKGGGRKKENERIEALEKAQERLDTQGRDLKLEWEMTFDKLSRLMGRLNARIRKSEAQNGPENDEQPEQGATPLPSPSGVHARMDMHRRRQ